MIFRRYLIRILTAALAMLATSCIDIREEFWLEADGSGRAQIAASLPAAVLKMQGGEEGIRSMISEFLNNTPEITSSACEINTRDGRTEVKVAVAFHSALDLAEIASSNRIDRLPSAATHLAGEVDVHFEGRTLDLERRISPGKALPGAGFLPTSTWQGHQLLYIVHLPAVASDHNATRVEDNGHTLVWDIPLANAINTPIVTRFRMDVPVPWKLVSGIAIPVCVGIAFAVRRFRRRDPTV